jgi:hypothetical protein
MSLESLPGCFTSTQLVPPHAGTHRRRYAFLGTPKAKKYYQRCDIFFSMIKIIFSNLIDSLLLVAAINSTTRTIKDTFFL